MEIMRMLGLVFRAIDINSREARENPAVQQAMWDELNSLLNLGAFNFQNKKTCWQVLRGTRMRERYICVSY